jgi:parallel beta-helix repeat protein
MFCSPRYQRPSGTRTILDLRKPERLARRSQRRKREGDLADVSGSGLELGLADHGTASSYPTVKCLISVFMHIIMHLSMVLSPKRELTMSYIRLTIFGCFVLLVRGARADINEINTCPYEILHPGQYHITKDLTCPVDGIQIMASDVQLHFDGHTLNGMGTGVFGVLVVGSNNSIFGGGTVTRFQFDIVVEGLSESAPTSGNQIVNITVTNSLNQGIVVVNSRQNTIINCTANTNGSEGFRLESDNTLISNTANNNGNAGILVIDNNNTLRANQTDGNGFNGIYVDLGASGNLIQANKAAKNTPFDLYDFNTTCDSNTWKANQFRTANQKCIR